MDSITARALRQWEADHPFVTESGSWECPACNSPDACAELADGRWICCSPEHEYREPDVGTLGEGSVPTCAGHALRTRGFIGHRFEFQTRTEVHAVRRTLEMLGYLERDPKPADAAPALVQAVDADVDEALEQAAADARRDESVLWTLHRWWKRRGATPSC